jgi:hypothetical protein
MIVLITKPNKVMNTLTTKTPAKWLLLLAVLPFLFNSCGKDDYDIRDEVTGYYDYTVELYEMDGNDLVYIGNLGDNYDLTGTMRVGKNSQNSRTLDFYDGDFVMFQGVDVKDAGNAIVFDIPTQEAWIGPGNFQVAGYDYWDVDSSKYHGAFIYQDESIEIAFSARVMDVNTGLVMILTAFKK